MLSYIDKLPDPIEKAQRRTWPEQPYRGLNFFTAADAPLFSERDEEIGICSELVGSLRTRMLLLHGRSGTGKSSFIRAGLVPRLLEQEAVASLTALDASAEALVIRCTADPVARIAVVLREAL